MTNPALPESPSDATKMFNDAHRNISEALAGNQAVTRLDAADQRAMQRQRPPVSGDLANLIERAEIFARSGFFSDAKSVAQAAVKIMIGQSIGLTDIAALSAIYLFESKGRTVITVGAHILAAKIRASDRYRFKIAESTDKRCEIHFYEKGFLDEPGWTMVGPSVFTLEEAQAADLLKKDNWKGYPQDMLYARALARGFRRYTSDLTAIVPYVPEEFADTNFRPAGMTMEAPPSAAPSNIAPRRASEAYAAIKWPTDRRDEWLRVHEGADMPQCTQSGCTTCRWDEWETACAACGWPMAQKVHDKCIITVVDPPLSDMAPRPMTVDELRKARAEQPPIDVPPQGDDEELPRTGDRKAVEESLIGKPCPKPGHGTYFGLWCPVCADPGLLNDAKEPE